SIHSVVLLDALVDVFPHLVGPVATLESEGCALALVSGSGITICASARCRQAGSQPNQHGQAAQDKVPGRHLHSFEKDFTLPAGGLRPPPLRQESSQSDWILCQPAPARKARTARVRIWKGLG